MTEKEKEKIFKSALKREVSPLLIGLRNEIKDLTKQVKKIVAKQPPEIQTVKEIDPTEFPTELSVNNFPKQIKVINPQKIVEVKGFKGSFKSLLEGINPIGKQLENITGLMRSNFSKLSDTVYKVKVENQKDVKFPDIQKVKIELTKELTEILKQTEVQRVKIENSTPKEAIPVILTDAQKKRFYDTIVGVIGGGGGSTFRTPTPRPGKKFSELLRSGGSPDLNVDGSVTPVVFTVAPPTGKKWYVHFVALVMEDSGITFKKFGGRAALPNGLELKAKEGGGVEETLGIFNQNGDFYIFANNGVQFESAATDIFVVQVNFKINTGTTLELKDTKGEFVKAIVNDNLTSIDKFNLLVEGYEIDE